MNLFITGCSGFIGRVLVEETLRRGMQVKVAIRSLSKLPSEVETIFIRSIDNETDWKGTLNDIDVVVHLASRVHNMNDEAADPLLEFRKINVEGTINLARNAAEAGVKKFVFISSIKVNGEQTPQGMTFTEDNIATPEDYYGISKLEAEQGLRQLTSETGMEIVIIRPPLVYGPDVKGNFSSMMRWVAKGIPLPLGAIHNQRSLVGLDNLVDFIITCIDHPAAANQTFLVADGEDLSTTDLLRRVGQAIGKPARLIPVPMGMLKFGAQLLGKQAMAQRLCGNLQVDISKARKVLGWKPPVSLDKGLRRAVKGESVK